jgi:hypothetical protein
MIGNQAVQRTLRTDAEEPEADLTRPASHRFNHDFSRIPIHPPAAGAIQTKLAINERGDSYEQEADRAAEQVMRTPEPQFQRACSCSEGCPNCHTEQPGREHESLQTKRVQASDTGQIAAPPIVHEALRSSGQPLDSATRAFMEPRFGYDFSRVRVHTDTAAEQSARDVKAHAYTVGNHIVLGAGRLAPQTSAGKRLLAHELTHVVQQSGATAKTVQREPEGATDINGTYDVEWKVKDDTAQVTYGKKSTTISLESQGNAAKLSQDLGITKTQAATVLRDIQAKAPRGKLLISFVQNKGNPRGYAIRKFREMRAGGLWNSDALARPPVEGIRRDVRVPGVGRPTLELSEYGYVFFESKDQPFTAKPSGTAQGIQEYQHLDAAGARAPARTAPVALVRVNEHGKIIEIVEHALSGQPEAVRGKLVREFGNAGWKTDFSAPPPGAAGAPPPIDAHKPPDVGKQPSPMDAHKPPDVGKQPSPMDAHKPPVISPGTGTGGAPMVSRFRAAGRFLAREAPGLALQLVFMAIFPPGVIFRQDRLVVLSGTKINPAAMDALAKQQAVFDKLFADDPAKAIYANLSVRLDYSVDVNSHGDLVLDLKDMTLVDLKITRDDVSSDPKKFNQTESRAVSKQITYSMLLYESEAAARVREYQEALKRYQECLQQPGAGQGAGAEPYSHCIPPRMKPIK